MPEGSSILEFTKNQYSDVREGYVTLDWNKVDSASDYAVTDGRNVEMFRGALPQAFVSGLENGEHHFSVAAYDSQGELIAQSTSPATVTVQHWSLGIAVPLFLCGLVVVLALFGLIVRGARQERIQSESVA